MRLFVAIELDEAARVSIAAEQARLARLRGLEGSSLKWVRPEHMHVTLAFLGEVDESRAAAAIDLMRAPMCGQPFVIVFSGLGVFPPRGAPRALWIGIRDGAQEILEVERQVAERMASFQAGRHGRRFHPHLTLARWRDSRAAARTLMQAASTEEIARITVEGATLIHSRLSQAGPTYTTLAHSRFDGHRLLPPQSD
jgi:2'-5' RNA ligase